MTEFYTIKIERGQTISDVAIQEYGCIEDTITLMDDNPDVFTAGILTQLEPATVINIRKQHENSKPQTMNYYRTQRLKVNTGQNDDSQTPVRLWKGENHRVTGKFTRFYK
jgi:hypothetical protein